MFLLIYTFPQCFKLPRDTLNQEPMCHQRDILVQIVNSDRHVTSTTSQLDVRMTGQDKVQTEISYRTAIQVKRVNLKTKK